MSEASHLAESLEELLATPDLSWFASYPAAVERLTSVQAAAIPGPRFNSVWGVTLHLTLCQRFALAVLRGENVEMGAFFPEGAWPPVHDPLDADAWEQAKDDLLTVNHSLAECVAGLSTEFLELELSPVRMKGYQYILSTMAHNSNHINEIVTIRHMQGFWLEKT
jgi:hypothetical protein